MSVVLIGEFESVLFPSRTSIAFVCTNALGSSLNPRTPEKRRFVYYDSSLSFCLLSDMLTKVSVIFSLCESDMKPIGSVIFYSP